MENNSKEVIPMGFGFGSGGRNGSWVVIVIIIILLLFFFEEDSCSTL